MLASSLGLVLFLLPVIYALHESYEADEYANVTLPCNFTLHGFSYPGLFVPIKRYWTIPNGTVIPDTFLGDDKFKVIKPALDLYDFSLNIAPIDEYDYGIYHCVLLWNNYDYRINVIQIGLNVEEPFYREQYEDFKSNVIIGGVITGLVFAAFLIGCIVCSCRYSRKSKNQDISHDFEPPQNSRPKTSVYGYGTNPGFEPVLYGGRKEALDAELYAHRDKRGSTHELRRSEDSTSQTVHF